MKTYSTTLGRLSPLFGIRNFFRLLFVAGGMMLVISCTRHTLPYDLGLAAVFVGFTVRSISIYSMVAALLFVVAVLLSLGPKTWQAHSITVTMLALAVAIYGWWKARQAKILAERQTHRP